jgi:uncharacterized protein YcbK (DUF882 family)
MNAARAGYSCALALLVTLLASRGLQNAVAEGDTRTITMHHMHTGEDITITYKRDGRYDEAALEKLNWFLRDWRKAQETRMDPHAIDILWDVHRESGAKEPIWIVCGYRSPETNEMLRRHSTGVARFSQHMLGRAIDFYIPGVPLENLRAIGLRLQRGGVGFYPTSGSPFVHMDTGPIRHWPGISREQLVRIFPDGRTIHVPTDGRPLPGFALAMADIRKRKENGDSAVDTGGGDVNTEIASNDAPKANPIAKLLNLVKRHKDEDEDEEAPPAKAETASMVPSVPAAVTAAAKKILPKRTAVASAETKDVPAAKAKPVRTVTYKPAPDAPAPAADDAKRVAALTPNQVITERWQTVADNAAPTQPAKNASARTVASADPDSTGALSPFSNAADDRRPQPALALGYAEQPRSVATQAVVQNSVTVAVKRAVSDVASAVVTMSRTKAIAATGQGFDNPWLRAVIWSPNVYRYLTTFWVGTRDYKALTAMFEKPSSALFVTFSADANPGLDHDRFSGSAVAPMQVVNYTKTADAR